MPRSTLVAVAPLVALAAKPGFNMNYTVYSAPVKLRYGQVYNHMQDLMRLPEELIERYADGSRDMAITGFDVDMVRRHGNGHETQVTLDDHYLHHYALNFGREEHMERMFEEAAHDKVFARMLTGCHSMKRSAVHFFGEKIGKEELKDGAIPVFGNSASGAEFRHNPQRFEAPFRTVIKQPEAWAPLIHIMRTKRPTKHAEPRVSPLIQCPCTPQRKINPANGTIDGRPADPPVSCSAEFAATGNPSCHLETYVGGWRCCEHEVFLIDTDKECESPDCSENPADEIFMKFTFFYEDATPATRAVEPAACCDVTSVTQGNENIEYDIPKCAPGTPAKDCIHVAESVQPLGYFGERVRRRGADLVDLVFAAPHLHVAGLSLTLMDAMTNETLCEVHRAEHDDAGLMYGHSKKPGDEQSYLVGLIPCTWGGATARRFRRDHPMRTRAVYNASEMQTGVMSLWLTDVAAADGADVLV